MLVNKRTLIILILLLCIAFPIYGDNLGWLKISNDKIINEANGQPVFLKGLGLSNGVFSDKGDASESMPDWAINEADIIFFKELGATVVRYCFSYKWFLNQAGFEKLDQDLALFEKYGLYVILNMHVPPGSGAGWGKTVGDELFAEDNWATFVSLWQKIAQRYQDREVIAAYEPFSEPKPESYDYLITKTKEIVAVIRKAESNGLKQHIIIVTQPIGLRQASQTTFKPYPLFKLDQTDNILYTFHFYEPWAFTHQPEEKELFWLTAAQKKAAPKVYHYPTQCSWIKDRVDKPVLENLIKSHVIWARKNNVPLYAGEFGSSNRAPIQDKLQWTKDVLDILEKYQVQAWTYWDYKNTYGWRYDFSLRNVIGQDLAAKNSWTQNHIREDTLAVNLLNQPLLDLLKTQLQLLNPYP